MQDNFDHRRADSSLVVCDGNDRPILLLLVVMRDTLQIGISRRWCREHRKNRLVYCDSECTPVRSQVDYSSIITTKNPLRQLQTTTRISWLPARNSPLITTRVRYCAARVRYYVSGIQTTSAGRRARKHRRPCFVFHAHLERINRETSTKVVRLFLLDSAVALSA